MRNVEIKAKVSDVERLIELTKKLCEEQVCTVLLQSDTFFKSPCGRLKLRVEKVNDMKEASELIYYDRPDSEGPKLSTFTKTTISDHENLKKTLAFAMGILGEVKKKRILYIYQQTRIHVDQVEGLGNFMELEVLLREDQTLQMGQTIAESIMQKLEIKSENLISGAYMDHLLSSKERAKDNQREENCKK